MNFQKLKSAYEQFYEITLHLSDAHQEIARIIARAVLIVIQKQRGLCRHCGEGFVRTDIVVSRGLSNRKYYHRQCADPLNHLNKFGNVAKCSRNKRQYLVPRITFGDEPSEVQNHIPRKNNLEYQIRNVT